MSKRWLSVIILAICICLIVPIIASCGCSNNNTDTNTDTEDTVATVTLKLNGGELPEGYEKVFEWNLNEEIDELPAPTKEGTEFVAWTVDGEAVEFPYLVTEDVTFVATWADGSVEDESDTESEGSNTDSSTDDESESNTDTESDGGESNTDTSTNSGSSGSTDTDNTDTDNTGSASELEFKSIPVLKYFRIAKLENGKITLKVNALGDISDYEIRYSKKEITSKNYSKATIVDCEVTGSGEIKTIVVDGMTADADNKYFFAMTAKNDFGESEFVTVRAGGIEAIVRDNHNPQHIVSGETNRDLGKIIDEQDFVAPTMDEFNYIPMSQIEQFWYEKGHVFPNYTKTETDERYGTKLAPIIDLEYVYYVDSVMLYYGAKTYDVVIRASKNDANFQTPEHWDIEYVVKAEDLEAEYVTTFPINAEVRYVQVEFIDGQAPVEVVVSGYAVGESENMEIKETTSHKRPTIGEMMGQCGFVAGGGGNCSVEQLACSYVIREYHNVGWSYSNGSFPGKAVNLVNTVVGNFDAAYKTYSEAGFLVIPCLQWNEGSSPARLYDDFEGKLSGTIASWEEKYLPSTYAAYADLIYQYSARYGSSKMGYLVENMIAHSDAVPGTTAGRGYIQWIELGNEPNGEDAAGATPYQLAALQSAAYDGHQRTLLADIYNPNSFSYPFGGKNADPDIKLAMAGLAGVGSRYIMSMAYWMRANRTDNCIAMDAFNVHTYFGKYFTMNGQQIIVGVSPEEFDLIGSLSHLVQYRDKYYPEVEVWLTEFGWDTNQSYETMTSAHAYNTKDANGDGVISDYEKVLRAREIQGMWLTRAYLLLSACGVDKATMYMCEDVGSNEATAIGKYGTCGIWYAPYTEDNWPILKAQMHDEEGKEEGEKFWVYKVTTGEGADEVVKYYKVDDNTEVKKQNTSDPDKDYSGITTETEYLPKDGYFYMYTLSETIGHMTFVKEIDSGNPDVWIYEFSDGKGQVGYAVWCPTSDGTVVENFKLKVDGNSAIHTTAKNGDIDGVSKNVQIEDGYVTITVTENPSYVVVK